MKMLIDDLWLKVSHLPILTDDVAEFWHDADSDCSSDLRNGRFKTCFLVKINEKQYIAFRKNKLNIEYVALSPYAKQNFSYK